MELKKERNRKREFTTETQSSQRRAKDMEINEIKREMEKEILPQRHRVHREEQKYGIK
jgi:hypothetical protein